MRIVEELITTGAPEVTPSAMEELIRKLPTLRARFASLDNPRIDLTLPLDFFAQVLEDFNAGLCRDLPYYAAAEIAFALLYLDSETDLIPDTLPDVGLADDAAVSNRVLVRHSAILKGYAAERGFTWADLQTL